MLKRSSTRDYGKRCVRGRNGLVENEREVRDGETCGWRSARSGGGSGWVKGIGQTKLAFKRRTRTFQV
jgi:hypothetical protein